jgi:phage terminase small subunit
MAARKSGKHIKRIQSVKRLVESGICTPLQSRFAIAFLETRNKTLAAIRAGYSKKNAAQSGHQAYLAIAEKAPEVIARMGITLENIIENHLLPKLTAKERKLAQHEGKFTDSVDVDAHAIQLEATKELIKLMGAYPAPESGSNGGNVTVILDVPRPDHSKLKEAVNVTPTNGNEPAKKTEIENGQKPDQRPKDGRYIPGYIRRTSINRPTG